MFLLLFVFFFILVFIRFFIFDLINKNKINKKVFFCVIFIFTAEDVLIFSLFVFTLLLFILYEQKQYKENASEIQKMTEGITPVDYNYL